MKTLFKLNEILKDIKKTFVNNLQGVDKLYTRKSLLEQFKLYSNDKEHIKHYLKGAYDLPLHFLNTIHPNIKDKYTKATYDKIKNKVTIEGKTFKYGFTANDLSDFCLPFMRLLALHYKAFNKQDIKDSHLTEKMIEDTFANEVKKQEEEKKETEIKDEWYLDKIKIFKDNIKNIKFAFVKPSEHNDYKVIKIKVVYKKVCL